MAQVLTVLRQSWLSIAAACCHSIVALHSLYYIRMLSIGSPKDADLGTFYVKFIGQIGFLLLICFLVLLVFYVVHRSQLFSNRVFTLCFNTIIYAVLSLGCREAAGVSLFIDVPLTMILLVVDIPILMFLFLPIRPRDGSEVLRW
ncbi:hypothetical protein QM565_30510 [Geitlerinema splendidum]|nr:hypothetical protein [Geitlerinema splendidum]